MWDCSTGQLIDTVNAHRGKPVNDVKFHPINPEIFVSAGDDKLIKIWETKTRRELHVLYGHRDGVLVVRFSHDGRKIATGKQSPFSSLIVLM
jgi:WD40 repeat protein